MNDNVFWIPIETNKITQLQGWPNLLSSRPTVSYRSLLQQPQREEVAAAAAPDDDDDENDEHDQDHDNG